MTSKALAFPVMPLEKWKKLARVGRASKDVTLRKGSVPGAVKAGERWLGLCRGCESAMAEDPTRRVPVKPSKEPL